MIPSLELIRLAVEIGVATSNRHERGTRCPLRSSYHRNRPGASVFLRASRGRHRHRSLPQPSSSASRLTAGASEFFILSQSGERPDKERPRSGRGRGLGLGDSSHSSLVSAWCGPSMIDRSPDGAEPLCLFLELSL